MTIDVRIVGDKEAVAYLKSMPATIRKGLSDGIKKQWFRLQAHVVSQKLSGQVLKRRTGVLASSINVGGGQSASEFIDSGSGDIIGRVGTKVRYAGVHEYGGTVNIPAHQRRLTMVYGKPVTPKMINVSAHNARFPERSFLRSSLRDRRAEIIAGLTQAVGEAIDSK